jgi:hypothetical protein
MKKITMNTSQKSFDHSVYTSIDRAPQSTQPGELMPTQPIEFYHPAWLKNGDSPAEIILSTAILVSAIAKLITASRTPKKW